MQNFIIKTHKVDTVYTTPHFFILNKGLNSGKPQKEPFTNSFVVIFSNEKECEDLFFVAYSMWKSNYWNQYLVGSVIPFLRISDYSKEFNLKSNEMMKEHEFHLKNIATLKILESSEKQFQKNLTLINELRRAIVNRYCKK